MAKGEEHEVGDSVVIMAGRQIGLIGEVVKVAYGTYIVEPYNYPYFNSPSHLTKIGPFSATDLVPVEKPDGASLEYNQEKYGKNFINQKDEHGNSIYPTGIYAAGYEPAVKVRDKTWSSVKTKKRNGRKPKKVESVGIDDIKTAFSNPLAV